MNNDGAKWACLDNYNLTISQYKSIVEAAWHNGTFIGTSGCVKTKTTDNTPINKIVVTIFRGKKENAQHNLSSRHHK